MSDDSLQPTHGLEYILPVVVLLLFCGIVYFCSLQRHVVSSENKDRRREVELRHLFQSIPILPPSSFKTGAFLFQESALEKHKARNVTPAKLEEDSSLTTNDKSSNSEETVTVDLEAGDDA